MKRTALLKLSVVGRRTSHFRYRFAPISRGIVSASTCDGDKNKIIYAKGSGSPASSELDGRVKEQIQEGMAFMSQPKGDAVFYSKVQVFNRDLSIMIVRLFQELRERELLEKYRSRKERYIGQYEYAHDDPKNLLLVEEIAI
jgi:hypothetical protein